jgi:hypothetical protein
MRLSDIKDGALEVTQNKTKKKLRILIEDELSNILDRIKSRNPKVSSLLLIATPSGPALTQSTLRIRFDNVRNIAEKRALELGDANLALKIRAFQFRDIRPKAAS